MVGLIISEVILFLVAGLIGFALGYRLHAFSHSLYRRAAEDDVTALRGAVNEAQVRRARPNT